MVILRGLRDQANKSGRDGAAMIICCTEWLIRVIEGWMKYFNRSDTNTTATTTMMTTTITNMSSLLARS